jgi:hypothetical protein
MVESNRSEKLQRGVPYPLGDPLSAAEQVRCETQNAIVNDVRVVWDGQPARPPKKGERFLSGASITAYRAFTDMTQAYYIGRLVRVKRVESWVIEEITKEV